MNPRRNPFKHIFEGPPPRTRKTFRVSMPAEPERKAVEKIKVSMPKGKIPPRANHAALCEEEVRRASRIFFLILTGILLSPFIICTPLIIFYYFK